MNSIPKWVRILTVLGEGQVPEAIGTPQPVMGPGCQEGLPRTDVHLRLTTGITEGTHSPL